MSDTALICGNFAYDTIMVLNDRFRAPNTEAEDDAVFVEEQETHYTIPDLRREFGGGAGNISYSLKMLGGEPLPMATVGKDFSTYAEWLDSRQISQQMIKLMSHSYTSQTFITIDINSDRIVAFHPGAMTFSSYNKVIDAPAGVALATVSADNHEAMLFHALQMTETGIPFVFDPSYNIYEFDGNDLLQFLEQTRWLLLNTNEAKWMSEKTGLSIEQIAAKVEAFIVTEENCTQAVIYNGDTRYQIPQATVQAYNDTNGSHDAFCAGLLYGLLKDIDWETTGRIAVLLSAIKIEHHGSQNHSFTLDSFKARFKKNFGYALIV